MSQYIKYRDIQDRNDLGQKFYRCDACGKIGLWYIVTYHGVDRCEECHAEYIHDTLVAKDYREASGGEHYEGD